MLVKKHAQEYHSSRENDPTHNAIAVILYIALRCMHIVPHILLNEDQRNNNRDNNRMAPAASSSDNNKKKSQSVAELEAQAVHQAKLSADAAFSPPQSVWKSNDPELLLQTVDGVHSLRTYDAKASTYVGRSVPIAAGGHLKIPIQVATPGSVVEYAVEIHQHDVSFGITAEREEGVTIVKVCTDIIRMLW